MVDTDQIYDKCRCGEAPKHRARVKWEDSDTEHEVYCDSCGESTGWHRSLSGVMVSWNQKMRGICLHCGSPISIRNPKGTCDHLQWPEYLTDEAKKANGIPAPEDPYPDRGDIASSYARECAYYSHRL